jgi:hypothetical protein
MRRLALRPKIAALKVLTGELHVDRPGESLERHTFEECMKPTLTIEPARPNKDDRTGEFGSTGA